MAKLQWFYIGQCACLLNQWLGLFSARLFCVCVCVGARNEFSEHMTHPTICFCYLLLPLLPYKYEHSFSLRNIPFIFRVHINYSVSSVHTHDIRSFNGSQSLERLARVQCIQFYVLVQLHIKSTNMKISFICTVKPTISWYDRMHCSPIYCVQRCYCRCCCWYVVCFVCLLCSVLKHFSCVLLRKTEPNRTNERNGERKGDRERTKESKVPSIYAWLLPIFVQARVFKYSYEFLKSLTNQLAINSITLLWPTQNVLYSCISRYFDGLPR